MCDMQERRCSLLDLGHGDVRYAGAAMLSAGLRHGDVRYAGAAVLFARPWARRCAICGGGDAPCCLNLGTAMCGMRGRRCPLLLELGHGDVRYAGAAMLSAGLKHGDVQYAGAAMLLAARPWAWRCAVCRGGDALCCLNLGTAMCDMRGRRCSLLDSGTAMCGMRERRCSARLGTAMCDMRGGDLLLDRARRCAICGGGDAPCCLNLGTAMCGMRGRRCSLLDSGTAMCGMRERRCSLLDLGHGNVQYAAMSLAGWRPNYSHTSFVNSVPNPQARWSNGWQRGHCAEAHRGTSELWLIPQSADCRASLHVGFISDRFESRLVCAHIILRVMLLVGRCQIAGMKANHGSGLACHCRLLNIYDNLSLQS